MSVFTRGRVRNFVIAALGLVLVGSVAYAIDGRSNDNQQVYVSYPEIDPSIANGCPAEAAAYAAALMTLNNAQQAAQDAYDAWYDCEMGGGSEVSYDISDAPEQSILVR